MAERSKPRNGEVAFRFSNQTNAQIRDVLGDVIAASVTPLLGQRVAAYLDRSQDTTEAASERQRLTTTLRAVVRCINKVSPTFQERLREAQSIGDMAMGTSRWQELTALKDHTAKILPRLGTRRGAPRKTDRERLCFEVAAALRLVGGIKITADRTGQFARILKVVLLEVRDPPDDVFLLAKKCSDFLKSKTDQQLHVLFVRALRTNTSLQAAEWAELPATYPARRAVK
jgi:hypothetical protein